MISKTRTKCDSALRVSILVLMSIVCVVPAVAGPDGVDGLLIAQPPQAAPQAAPQVIQPAAQPNPEARRDAAFDKAIRETLPMTTKQIGKFRTDLDGTRKSISTPLAPGRPVSRSINLTLKPGEDTPILRVELGNVSTMTFSDITGQPWPVLAVTVGNPNAYKAQSAGEEGKTNIIVVSATEQYSPGNLAVTLVGHPVPVTIALRQGEPENDFRLDVRIASRGPNAATDIVGTSSLAPTNDSSMIKFLDGTPPDGAKRLRTSSPEVEAWRFDDMLYVRTAGDVLSPAYVARSSNVSGVNVFAMVDAPVVLVSVGGRANHVRITR